MLKKFAKFSLPVIMAGCLTAINAPVQALDTGDLLVRGRIININPSADSGNVTSSAVGGEVAGTEVDVEDAYSLDIDFTYMFTPNIGAELLLDVSSKHDVVGKGSTLAPLGTIIETRVLPPALILQYHFLPDSEFRPYAGLGLNYTMFFSEEASSSLDTALGGVSDVELDSSFGWVGQIGMDYDLGNDLFFNLDVKYMDINTTATFNSGALGNVSTDVDINPWVFGIGVGKRFSF
jgi:outer membrane protein